MNYSGRQRLEATEGKKSKASPIQMIYLIVVVAYLIFYTYIAKEMTDEKLRDIIFGVMSVIAIIFMVINSIYNRKRKDKTFVWNIWALSSILFFVCAFRYALYFLD